MPITLPKISLENSKSLKQVLLKDGTDLPTIPKIDISGKTHITNSKQTTKNQNILTTPAKLEPYSPVQNKSYPTNHLTKMTENIKLFIISIQNPPTSRIKSSKEIDKQDHKNKNYVTLRDQSKL